MKKTKGPISAGKENKKKTRQKVQNKKEKELRVLILEDNPANAELIEHQLKKAGISFVSEQVKTRTAFQQALKKFHSDVILADYSLPKFDALQAEKKSAEESRQTSELLYRTFIDSSIDMAFLKDEKFRHLLANRELCRFYGKPEKEILGRTDFELMNKKTAAKCQQSDQQALAENKIHISEETIGERTFETRKFPVKLGEGRVGVGGYIRDISSQIQAESKIYESEAKYRLISENSADVIWILDIASQRFTYISPSVFKLRGLTQQQVLAEPMANGLTPESYQGIVARLPGRSASLAAGDESARVRTNEVDQVRRDGSIVHTEVVTTLLTDADGRVTEILGVTRDITERKHAEEQIQDSLREKEVLLKEIHHRVKNNLQIISGLLSLQGEKIEDERLQRLIKESQSRIWTMALIHQTLYQSGDLADIDMAEYIRTLSGNLLSSHAQLAMPPTINFDLLPLRLVVDKAIPLALIINELLTNAMKHAFPDVKPGEIRIALHEYRDKSQRTPTGGLAPAEKKHAPLYELVVADNGKGLPTDFDQKSQKSLGLQLVAMLAKQLGGTLAIESSGGTSVHIIFSNNEKKEK